MVSFVTELRAYDAFDLPRARYLWRSYSAGASVVVCVPGFVFVLVVVLGASSLGGFGLLCKILYEAFGLLNHIYILYI